MARQRDASALELSDPSKQGRCGEQEGDHKHVEDQVGSPSDSHGVSQPSDQRGVQDSDETKEQDEKRGHASEGDVTDTRSAPDREDAEEHDAHEQENLDDHATKTPIRFATSSDNTC